MESRWSGATHRIELGSRLAYTAPDFDARIDPVGFKVEHIEAKQSTTTNDSLSLLPCAAMYVLMTGLLRSQPHFPAVPGGTEGCIPYPAFGVEG